MGLRAVGVSSHPLPLSSKGYVEDGEKVIDVQVSAATFAVAWHPKEKLLAYACDDKVGCHVTVM